MENQISSSFLAFLAPSHVARRMISTLPIECSFGCGTKMPRGDLSSHQKKCHKRNYTCPRNSCSFTGNSEEYKTHIIKVHSDDLIEVFDSLELGKKFSKKGNVKGYYIFDGEQHPIEGDYRLKNGKLIINTEDDVGPAEWIGEINMQSLVVKIIKTYIGAHSVEYEGRIDEKIKEINGRWTVTNPFERFSDDFQLVLEE